MSNKKINARVEKWRTMLSTGLFKDPQLLHSRIRKGIPPSVRMIAWPELVKLRKHIEQRSVQYNYQKLTNSLSRNVYQITLDIPRTFPQQQDSKVLRKSMNNVLKAIAIVHPKIGYCQGMNFLAVRVLEVLDDQQAFWLLDYLIENDRYLRNNFTDPKHIDLHSQNFETLLSQHSPNLYKTLKEKSIHLFSFTMKSFMTLFSSVLRQEFFNRVFQVYLIEGWSIIYAVALNLFLRNQKKFHSSSMEEIHTFIGQKIFEVNDVDQFMSETYKLDIQPQQINTLEKQYMATLRESQKLKQNSDVERRQQNNRQPNILMPQIQNVGTLVFQNKVQQLNFDALYILKNQH